MLLAPHLNESSCLFDSRNQVRDVIGRHGHLFASVALVCGGVCVSADLPFDDGRSVLRITKAGDLGAIDILRPVQGEVA